MLAIDYGGRRGLLLDERWLNDEFLRHSLAEHSEASALLRTVARWRSGVGSNLKTLLADLTSVQQAASEEATAALLDFMEGDPQPLSTLSRNTLFADQLQRALVVEYGFGPYGPLCTVQSYSGRGMCGETCLGISLSDDFDTDSIIADTLNDWADHAGQEEVQRLQELLRGRNSESLGRGSIRYFPAFALERLYTADTGKL
ncbi:hypothetical protein [Deinococcus sp. Marseille-Q6407]|uniref:hypothetical protein n=1 Tax=Deinococcus sp. Marseille-Q6407 TaxID=2969223 RepID=UPI0021BED1A8|nr:hypothetical protein [Deinococcus sp. Marseille-Q6407]